MLSYKGEIFFIAGNQVAQINTSGIYGQSYDGAHGGNVEAIADIGGSLWFTEQCNNSRKYNYACVLGRRSAVSEYRVPASYGTIQGIAGGGDGNIYVAAGQYLLCISPSGSILSTDNLGIASGASDLLEAPNGNIWFNQGVLDQIGVITSSAPAVTRPAFASASAASISAQASASPSSADDLVLGVAANQNGLFAA
jgi:hypothetical protein